MDFSIIKLMTDEPLWITHFIITRIFKYRLVLKCFLTSLVLRFAQYLVDLCTLCTNPQLFVKYVPWVMAEPFGFLSSVMVLANMEFMNNMWCDFDRWSIDTAGAQVEKRIKAKIRNHHIFVVITLLIGGITTISTLYPNANDCDIYIDAYRFKQHYPEYSSFYNFAAKLSFGPMAFSMFVLVMNVCYGIEHTLYQWHLLVEYLRNITVEYNGMDESVLLNDQCYQTVLKERIKFFVERHVQFLTFSKKVNVQVIQQWYVVGTIFGSFFLLYLAMTAYGIYLGTYESTFFTITYVTSVTSMSLICLANIVHGGQCVEDESENVLKELVQSLRWISYNKPNRKSIQIVLVQAQRLMSLRFTEELSCNYVLGLDVIKRVYSAVSAIMSIRT